MNCYLLELEANQMLSPDASFLSSDGSILQEPCVLAEVPDGVSLPSKATYSVPYSYNKLMTDQTQYAEFSLRPTFPIELTEESSKEYCMKIREKTPFESVEEYFDKWPLLELRKALLRIKFGTRQFCRILISNAYLEWFIILVITLNTITLSIEDSLRSDLQATIEHCYLYIYTVEALLKIGGLGFCWGRGTYLRDSWNILDFAIVVTAWVEVVAKEGVRLNALRTLRVLRPLRSISSIEGLRVLMAAIIGSIKPLLISLVVFVFFLSIFAIAGLQLWMGLLKYRCLHIDSGEIMEDLLCGDLVCPLGYECALTLDNPNNGATNYDNFLYALLATFQSVTLEGWSSIMADTQKAFSPYAFIYHVPLVFVGAYLLLNFSLAVIKSSFTKAMNQVRQRKKPFYFEEEEDLNTSMIPDHKLTSEYSKQLPLESLDSELNSKRHSLVLETSEKRLKFKGLITAISNTPLNSNGPQLDYSDDDSIRFSTRQVTALHFATTINGAEILKEIPSFHSDYHKPIRRPGKLHKSMSIVSTYFLKKSGTMRYTRNRDSLVSLLSRQGANFRAQRGVVSKIKFGQDFDEFVYGLPEDSEIVCESKEDVTPTVTHIEPRPRSEYEFSYAQHGQAYFHLPMQHFSVFAQKARQHPFKKAFLAVLNSAEGVVQEVSEKDRLSQAVVGAWSGQFVSPTKKTSVHIARLSRMEYALWARGVCGTFSKFQWPFRKLVSSRLFGNLMTIAVVVNTIVLSLDHYGISDEMETVLQNMNFGFAVVFVVEMVLKLVGLGITSYFSDVMNYLDAVVVCLSCVEIAFLSGNSTLTAFRTFRVFRVLRVARLFRYMKSMAAIMSALNSSIYNFLYLGLLLLLFLLIFTLLGMEVFGGQFDFEEGTPRANFDDFSTAFVTVFQVLSLENWQQVLYDAMRSPVGPASVIFFVLWIFLGNFILLNLLLAILLDSFDQEEEEQTEVEAETPRLVRKESLFRQVTLRQQQRRMKQLEMLENDSDDESKSLEELRRLKSQKTQRTLFHNIHCTHSFFVFSQENSFRIWCYNLANSIMFENLVLCLICLSSLKLVWDTYILEESSDSVAVLLSWYLDVLFTVLFAAEFVLKSVSAGFVADKNSYLRDSWNQLDLFIIVFSVVELSVLNMDIQVIKVLRLLRTLRPLRFISHNLSMKLVVTALFESLLAILNVVIVLLIVWLIFAILGVALFSGKFYSCENSSLVTQVDCEKYGFGWVNEDTNFDNILNAMIALFIISSLEGWPEIMKSAIDARGPGLAPVRNYNPASAYYFVAFIFVGSFFFINFFIGVVFMQFNRAKRDESSVYTSVLAKKHRKWLEMQGMILESRPQIDRVKMPQNWLRLFFYQVSKDITFEMIILSCILLNMASMAIAYEGASQEYFAILEAVQIGFNCVFILEALIKIIGLGPRAYFCHGWNKFDFIVVVTSCIDMLTKMLVSSQTTWLLHAPQLVRVIRVLRVSRLIRIFKDLRSLQDLVIIMAYSLKAILNVLSLLLLLFFIYAILGVFIFYDLGTTGFLDEYFNFENFGMAMLTLFRISTGEDWQLIMYECSKHIGLVVSVLYFGSFVIITMFVMLNLFIMVIVQTYEDYEKDPKNALQVFTSDERKFKKIWAKFAHLADGIRIDFKLMPDLMRELGELDPRLGIEPGTPYSKIIKILSLMDIFIDGFGYVYYNDMLYAVLQRRHAKGKVDGKLPKKILKREDIVTGRKLFKLREKNKSKLEKTLRRKQTRKSNLFMTMITAKAVFRSWKHWTFTRREQGSSGQVTPAASDYQFPGFNSIVH